MVKTGQLTTHIISNITELEALRDEWDALLTVSPGATIFQSYDWNVLWLKYFGRGKKLRVITVMQNDKLVGIAPLLIAKPYGLPIRRLQFTATGPSDYLDITCHPENTQLILQEIIKAINEMQSEWDQVDLQQIPNWSALLELNTEVNQFYRVQQEPCPFLTLPETNEMWLKKQSSNLRRNIKQNQANAEKLGEVSYAVAGADEIESIMNTLIELHTKRWQKRWLPGVLNNPKVKAFHLEFAQKAFEQNRLRLYTLKIDDDCIAVHYCLNFNGRNGFYIGGYDTSYSGISPGTLLHSYGIQTAIQENTELYDFLRGDEQYKYRFTKEETYNTRLIWNNPNWKSNGCDKLVQLETAVEHWFKTTVKKIHRKQK